MKATATAHPNIAVVKYWGKRDEALILPHQSSVSLTLGPLAVEAAVEFGQGADAVVINGVEAQGKSRARVVELVNRVRKTNANLGFARVETRSDVPEAAGLASSAAAFAALAVATRAAAGLPADTRRDSELARLGSGSACRSVFGGAAVWHRGDAPDGHDSVAEQILDESAWPELRVLMVMVDRGQKETSSRDGMRLTVETSPYYPAWVETAQRDTPRAIEAIKARDLARLGPIAESNAMRMHASALGALPPLSYWKGRTVELLNALPGLRAEGLEVFATIDAGPNPALLVTEKFERELMSWLTQHNFTDVVATRLASGARVVRS